MASLQGEKARSRSPLRSAACTTSDGSGPLPVIDVSPWYQETSVDKKDEVVNAVRTACENIGFLVVTGIPNELTMAIARAEAAARTMFLNRAEDTIESCLAAKHGDGAYGYFPQKTEALGYSADSAQKPDIREAFSMGPIEGIRSPRLKAKASDSGTDDAAFFKRVVDFCYQPTPWPTSNGLVSSDEFRCAMEGFYRHSSAFGSTLLEIMALALGLDHNHFSVPSGEGENCNSARAIWYPRLAEAAADGQMRCGPHSDTGALTLLWCDGPGLEVQMKVPGAKSEGVIKNNLNMLESDGRGQEQKPVSEAADSNVHWSPVYPRSAGMQSRRSLIVNIGDLLQKASGDRWKSTPHRVPAPKTEDPENQDRLVLVQFIMLAADFPMGGTTQGEYSFGHFKRWGRNKG